MNNIITLLSSIVIILLFIIERVLSNRIRKKEIERSWYYKVLIDPNINVINDFFNKIQCNYKEACSLLKSSENKSHSDYISIKSSENGKFQELKREFELNIISPISYRHNSVSTKLIKILMDIEDVFTSNLDSDKFSQDDSDAFSKMISSKKGEWLDCLYEPIK